MILGKNYSNLNEMIGALECCKQEYYRAIVGPYEDMKIDENGDVSNTIEVWTIEGGKVTSTGRFESP